MASPTTKAIMMITRHYVRNSQDERCCRLSSLPPLRLHRGCWFTISPTSALLSDFVTYVVHLPATYVHMQQEREREIHLYRSYRALSISYLNDTLHITLTILMPQHGFSGAVDILPSLHFLAWSLFGWLFILLLPINNEVMAILRLLVLFLF